MAGPTSEGFARDFTEHDDGIEWGVSRVLGTWFETKLVDRFRGKRILELGAGLGLLAQRVARLGGTVTACERAKVLAALQSRIDAAKGFGEQGGSVTVAQCDWGESHWEAQKAGIAARGPFDIIILCELYYDDNVHEELLWTLQAVCQANGPHPIEVYSGFKNRPYSLQFLALVHDTEHFDVSPVPDDDIDLLGIESSPGDEVLLHVMKYKP
eukprot:m.453614 g.453614  ORF g.453614 m.453614 type:complete len:212 (-) comp20527_c0_seq1:9-644(-)